MIFRFAERDAGALFKVAHDFCGKSEMPIQPGADGGAAKREFLQGANRLLRAAFPKMDLLGVATKFLAEPHRRRIH